MCLRCLNRHLRHAESPANWTLHRSCLQTVAEACRTGASTNIIFGLALGYQSCIVPTIVLAVIIYISFSLANMYGVACAALGMLGTLATGALQRLVSMAFKLVY